jgi:hypothetical protein
MSKQHTPEHVSRTATCKRCGSTTVTWQRSDAGKWFLTEVFSYPSHDGDHADEMSSYTDFHSNYCGKPAERTKKVNEIHAEYAAWMLEHQRIEEQNKAKRDELEAQRIENEADKLAAFLRMTRADRAALIAKLENQIKYEQRDLTMDYMSEYNRSIIIIEGCRAEVSMYLDFMDDVEED